VTCGMWGSTQFLVACWATDIAQRNSCCGLALARRLASPTSFQKLVERMTFWFFRGAVGACVKVIMVTADQS
jgi:hypothetical protein